MNEYLLPIQMFTVESYTCLSKNKTQKNSEVRCQGTRISPGKGGQKIVVINLSMQGKPEKNTRNIDFKKEKERKKKA